MDGVLLIKTSSDTKFMEFAGPSPSFFSYILHESQVLETIFDLVPIKKYLCFFFLQLAQVWIFVFIKATVKVTTTYEHYEHSKPQTTCNIHFGMMIKLFFEKSIFQESIMAGEPCPK